MLGHKPQKPIAPGAIASSFENYSKHIMGALPRIVLGFALVFIGMIILGVGIMFLGVSPLKGSLLILLSWWVGWKEGWSKRISFFDEKFRKQKVSLHFVDVGGEVTGTDAMGSVFLKLLSVFAEFYAKQVSEKTKATKQRMVEPTIMTQDCAASVQIEARIPPA